MGRTLTTESELYGLASSIIKPLSHRGPFGHILIVFVLIQCISGLFLSPPEFVPLSLSAGQHVVVFAGDSLQLPGSKHCCYSWAL